MKDATDDHHFASYYWSTKGHSRILQLDMNMRLAYMCTLHVSNAATIL